MQVIKTPESAFSSLHDFPYTPHYVQVTDTISSELSMAYYQTGSPHGHTVVLLHGEPTWAYLYRKMMPVLAEAGFNVLVPDLIGFGRSDKPLRQQDYTYARHLIWLKEWFNQTVTQPATMYCQDWGGLLGLRLVADMPDMFSGVVAANTGLPTGDHAPTDAFIKWRRFSQQAPDFCAASVVKNATCTALSKATLDGYNAPFPSEQYKAGARRFPLLVPVTSDDPQSQANRDAWTALQQFDKPFMTAFSDSDPITAGGDKIMHKLIPGCQKAHHTTVKNAGHFLQEDKGVEIAKSLINFIQSNTLIKG
ncbi:alpha/beta fold hydrolase [Alteromonas sp. 345S023]|uniref:Alpha/beta fold hydrolase n=1 Tax=Alteromonas profundi TaxID=2696062 RepID=A0A7X5LJU3_9ALTE|nr:haloalkane dehalogenase [Alteromonas profundi]NDV90682.1 alpha/beta fold hydrolase [Alteromonas profundi]